MKGVNTLIFLAVITTIFAGLQYFAIKTNIESATAEFKKITDKLNRLL